MIAEKYQQWINNYRRLILNRSVLVSNEMKKEFPELTVVKGHLKTLDHGEKCIQHQWLTDPEGNIVDPTKAQYNRIVEYIPFKPENLVLLGRCHSCGKQTFGESGSIYYVTCSDDCHKEYTTYISR